MADVEHSTLSDPELHEPKGASSASSGEVYVADGAGSGAWTAQTALDSYTGWVQYADSTYTSGSPLAVASGVRTKLTNDGGTEALTSQLPLDAAGNSMWDTTNSKIVPISENDGYDFRLNFVADPAGTTDTFIEIELDIGGAVGVIFKKTVPLAKGGAAQQVVFSAPVYAGDTFFANGGEFYVTPDVNTDIYDISVHVSRTHRGR